MIRRVLIVALIIVLVGELLALSADGQTRPAVPGVDTGRRRAEMQGHYAELVAIHDAVALGDLEAARQPAMELAYLSVPSGSPLGAAGFGVEIRDGARRVARETTVVGAARATVSIIRACAGCHRANHASISSEAIVRRQPAGLTSMTGHVQAADAMLLGLLLPSDAHWVTGAEGLESSMTSRGPGAGPAGLAETMRHLTGRSKRSTTDAARASSYVELLTTCAECHQAVRR